MGEGVTWARRTGGVKQKGWMTELGLEALEGANKFDRGRGEKEGL